MGTTTTTFGLYKPANGETGWGTLVDANWDTIDTALKALFDAAGLTWPLPPSGTTYWDWDGATGVIGDWNQGTTGTVAVTAGALEVAPGSQANYVGYAITPTTMPASGLISCRIRAKRTNTDPAYHSEWTLETVSDAGTLASLQGFSDGTGLLRAFDGGNYGGTAYSATPAAPADDAYHWYELVWTSGDEYLRYYVDGVLTSTVDASAGTYGAGVIPQQLWLYCGWSVTRATITDFVQGVP